MKRTKQRFDKRLLEVKEPSVRGRRGDEPAVAEQTFQTVRPVHDAPERPTTFQLAQLAAILATRPESVRIPPAEVVLEALQVWDAAAKVNLSERQEREIREAVFTDRREEWERRLSAYVGDEIRLRELLAEPRFDRESEALPKLFSGKEQTAESRRQAFEELLRYAKTHSLLEAESPDANPGVAAKLSSQFVRTLVEAQEQRSKGTAKARSS